MKNHVSSDDLQAESIITQKLSAHKHFPFLYGRTETSIIMEFVGNAETLVPGLTVSNLIRKPNSTTDWVKLSSELIDAVSHMHAQKLLHNDIHYQNVMVHPVTGFLKLIDFGKATTISAPNSYEVVIDSDEHKRYE